MYGQVLGASTLVTGTVGVAVLPNTGSTKLLFTIAAFMLAVGVITFAVSSLLAFKQRATKA